MLLLAACGGGTKTYTGDLLLTADRLFDGHELRQPGALLLRGGEIVAVGRTLKANATRTIELGDATILPGFIDLHVHQHDSFVPENGVLTVRDLGEPMNALRPPEENAPVRVLAAGPLVTVPGGYPTPVWGSQIALDVRSPADGRKAVADLARRGAAVIKIALEPGGVADWPLLTVPEVRAIVEAAHAHGLQVTAHVTDGTGLQIALDGHVDELAHMPCFNVEDDQVDEVVKRRIPVVATLHVSESFCLGRGVQTARRVHEAGGTILYGTDFGNPGIPSWIDVDELRLLRKAGLSPEEVLAAGTAEAGKRLGRAPLGSLEAGAPADVIAVRGDARELADDMTHPLLVVRAGKIVLDPRG